MSSQSNNKMLPVSELAYRRVGIPPEEHLSPVEMSKKTPNKSENSG